MNSITQTHSKRQQVAFVLPAYNEEQDLPALLERIHETMSSQPFGYHIIVVDDGSKDRTAEIAIAASETMPVRLIKHEVNKGLGAAMQTGLSAAMREADFVATMDSDNSHDPAYIAEMVQMLNQDSQLDVVIASRYQSGSIVKGVPAYRQVLSYGCFFMLKALAPMRYVRDYSTGFRCYRADVLQRVAMQYNGELIKENGFVCQLELLLKMRSIRAHAAEIPYTLRYDLKVGVSKLRLWRTVKRYFSVIWKHRKVLPESATMPLPTAQPQRA
jgi:dolichol-phosphate mannosyltransferase